MKVIITGEPRSGKSFLLARAIGPVQKKQGFCTLEIRKDGERIGFEMIRAINGKTALLASAGAALPQKVSKYGVNVPAIDEMSRSVMEFSPEDLLYIDEIGEMQLFSEDFKSLVRKYLDADNDFIATLTSVYSDKFIKELQERPDIIRFYITQANQDDVFEKINKLLHDRN